MSFWKLLLKDALVTILGVFLFCALMALILIGSIATIADIAASSNDEMPDYVVEKNVSGSEHLDNKVVILPIDGTIETDEYGFLANAVKAIRDDKKVKAVVLRINSPGGTISGSDYYYKLFTELKRDLNIPIVISMSDLTASGGYYISMAGDRIFAERSTLTGSIGVIIPMYNAAELCEKLGVSSNAVTSGAMKGMGDFMKEPTEEETAIWQSLVDESYEQFLDVVCQGRAWFQGVDDEGEFEVKKRNDGVPILLETNDNKQNGTQTQSQTQTQVASTDAKQEPDARSELAVERREELRKIADGRIYTAKQALELHLVDELGFLDDAVDDAIIRAGLQKIDTQIVRYEEEDSFLQKLGLEAKFQGKKLDNLVESVSTPRAYYLCARALPTK